MKTLLTSLLIITFLISSCNHDQKKSLEKGVSKELAENRFEEISDIAYHLEMNIPDSINIPIKAKASVNLTKKDITTPLVFDFVSDPDHVIMVRANNEKVYFSLENEHLVIPGNYLKEGENNIEIEFWMGEGALNRNEKYLYSLFVPDRARTVIPCFDQPDLKAKVSYAIDMPKTWTAITNGKPYLEEETSATTKRITYSESKPISTYLWAFAVGEFKKVSETRNGMEISMYHQEKDSLKLSRSIAPVFDQVFHSLQWLENFTHIKYPFNKYDLVCIPSFQFSGMEHPGAVYYRQEKLFLSETPTQEELLNRAQLIAHETAHMWFGDLVTMKWFSGVWQKEVFANFMADKIVKEQFPNLNHELTFLTTHFPSSFSVDRTQAANPIEQKLDNLENASSMYGTIIYHKAPIVMNQLEKLMGDHMLQQGLRKYLATYSYKNASWADLIKILTELSEYDLELWSKNWVNEPGRPIIEFVEEDDQLFVKQTPEYSDSSKVWAQRIKYMAVNNNQLQTEDLELLTRKQKVADEKPQFILPSVDASGYGLFLFDPISLEYALNNVYRWQDDLITGSVLVHLYENLLHGNVTPEKYLTMLCKSVEDIDNEQLLSLVCDQLSTVFWRCSGAELRTRMAPELEEALLNKMNKVEHLSIRRLLIKTWANIALTPQGLKKLRQVVIRKKEMADVQLSERDLSTMAMQLALKDSELDDAFLLTMAEDVKDEDVRGMMEFVSPVFSKDDAVIDAFVEGLSNLENRKKENWVLTAMAFIHHPYHQEHNIKYLNAALELTKTIKETGSLFFPMSWVQVTLRGYGSAEALKIVGYFFKDNPVYPEDLKAKILQSLDMVSRVRKMKRF
ncbi:M1 family metallopeptidase [Plebeiibacterium sediminum]|uniref:Aminopeptidase N n=1 Tax=Plebeiibacterium sediminum TaxID=2992112 RepID=A0AAE3SDQ8_9BACT|nr:M1 family aminopeptidase [Plebeiobacterium sediminum]MCW3785683.1 M1 family aminopeptidase [Plebeiobacterium sediminum]